MKVLSVFLTLCTIVTLSRAYPLNATQPWYTGLCEYERLQCTYTIGEFCPQCDANGNFLPQQCWQSTGHCWCVDTVSGREIPNTNTPPGVLPVNCGGHWYCPDGWSSYGEMCFAFINTPKKWIEAEVYCQFDGANLASVHSEEENHFIMSLTRGETQDFPQTWLGGFDAIHPGYWMWSDGSDFIYENWYNKPYKGNNNRVDNDDNGNDHDDGNHDKDDNDDEHHDEQDKEDYKTKKNNCLKINYEYDLKWFYDSCTNYLPFVCAKKAHSIYY